MLEIQGRRDGAGADDRRSEREHRQSALHADKRKRNSSIKRGDFVLIDRATKFNKPEAVATDQTWTGYVGEVFRTSTSRIFNIVAGSTRFSGRFLCARTSALVKPIASGSR